MPDSSNVVRKLEASDTNRSCLESALVNSSSLQIPSTNFKFEGQ